MTETARRSGMMPGTVVGVVFVGTDEPPRPLMGGNGSAQVVPVVEIGGYAQTQHPDEQVDGPGGARSAEDHRVLLGGSHRRPDDVPGLLPEPAGLQARPPTLGLGW